MAGYVIAHYDIKDETLFDEFVGRARAIVKAYGGKVIVRGGIADVVVGDWTPDNVVVIEFDSVEKAEECYRSPDYTEAFETCAKAAKGSIVILEGL